VGPTRRHTEKAGAPFLTRNGGKRALLFLVGASTGRPSETLEDILTTLGTITKTALDLGKEAKTSIEEFSRSAGGRLDEARDETGDALHSAASSVRATGRRGSEAIENLAAGTADRLDATASYVEDHDLRGVLTDLRKFGRRHLTGSLVAVAAIGFLAGFAFRRATHSCGNASERA
jgi:hypothetical protein